MAKGSPIYLITRSVIDSIWENGAFWGLGSFFGLYYSFQDGFKCLGENKSQKCEVWLWIFICIYLLCEQYRNIVHSLLHIPTVETGDFNSILEV